MKKNRFLLLSLASLLVVGGLTTFIHRGHFIERDNITYDQDTPSKIEQPDFVRAGDAEEIPDVEKVVLHYHNDDGKCGLDTTTLGTAGGRSFYIWVNGKNGKEFLPDEVSNNGQDMMLTVDFSKEEFSMYAGKSSLLFIIKYRMIDEKQGNWGGQSSDTELSYEEFPPNDAKTVEVWTMHSQGSDIAIYKTEAETKVDGVKTAYFTNWKTIHCINSAEAGISYSVYAFDETYFKISAKVRDNKNNKRWYLIKEGESSLSEFDITFEHSVHINIVYCIESLDKASVTGLIKKTYVTYDKLYDDTRFETYYTYDGDDLGMTYTPTETTFKVWAPTAGNMSLFLYDVGATTDYGGSNKYKGYHMNYVGHGVWSKTITGDLKGKFYTYFVDNTSGSFETMDPYATACGVNGLRGYVYDKNDTNPTGWDELPTKWDGSDLDIATPQDLTVYEVHVQDFTGDESWNGSEKPGTYNAFVEKGTHLADNPTVSTGFDHINELGVNAVQILPFFDHDNDETNAEDYNWGYNPLNYNCVEGAYSSDPTDPLARISEVKNMVLELSKTDVHTRVIMDVVYNHVSRASASCFTRLMPKYYFRYTESGEYADGSGCSNEIRSEATMMRKYIVDSVMMWAKEYKIKGFRFDLMGLIDVQTMKVLKEKMYEFDPDVVLYGEGWSLGYNGKGVPGANTANVGSMLYESNTSKGYVGGFNDAGRNALRGGNDGGWGSDNARPGWGFLQKGDDCSAEIRNDVANMLWGINSNGIGNPKQTVNYASCHDNWTVFDQLYYTLGDAGNGVAPSYKTVMDTSVVAHSLVMASNGIAFMLGGEELFRTKELNEDERAEVNPSTYELLYDRYCSHNSYNAPLSVNSFKWGNKVSAYGVNTSAYFDNFKAAIKLHQDLKKVPYKEPYPYTQTSAGTKIDNISWAGNSKTGEYNGSAGFQLDEYFIFATGRQWAYVGSDAHTWTKLYEFGEWKHGDYGNSVDLGNYANNTGAAIVIFKRK
ncbi:MAG: hypothetical protein IJQ67_03030 [Bacilli bacterium]|nr:hypothetical protein [Bacilli bacterium]